jgi:type IV pilus assembly protein PilC
MPAYRWKAKNKSGKVQSGEIEAQNEEQIRQHLRKQGFGDIWVKKKPKEYELVIPGITNRITLKDLVVFTRTFSTMVDAGLPLIQCLDILAQQTENKAFAKTVKVVKTDVEAGSTFANALRKHPKVFDKLFCNMVEAGEAGGILDTIMQRLAVYMEKSMALRRKVKGAMIYPAAVITIAVSVVSFLMVYVIPTFAEIFLGLGTTLPMPTQIVINISKWMQANFLTLLAGVIVLGVLLRYFYKTEFGRRFLDRMLLRAPVFGPLFRKIAVARFTRTLGTLISSGVPILDGLEITARTAGNKIVEEAVMKTRTSISEGRTISEPLSETDVFPPMVVQMISVGEQTGALDQMLGKIADFYDDEVDQAVSNMTQLIEPAMIAILGVLIGGIVIAMYLPMFKLIGELNK